MSIRVLVAEDHEAVRKGLVSLLEKQEDMEVIAEAKDGTAAVRLAGELKPDVIVMDLTLPGLSGMDATREIVAEVPAVKVLVISMHSDSRFVVRALQAGASGYVLKDRAFEELVPAIRAVASSQTYVSPGLAGNATKT